MRLGLSSAAICCLVIVGALGGSPAMAGQRALLVGIGDYAAIQPLASKDIDLERMTEILVDHWGFETHEIAILRDQRATRRNILRTIKSWLISSTESGDRVVFYYAGHGAQLPDLNGDEQDGQDETLAAYDTAKDGDIRSGQILDDEIEDLLARLADRDVTLIIDSCHSGTISRAASPKKAGPNLIRTFTPPGISRPVSRSTRSANRRESTFVEANKNMTVWSAASASQFSWEQAGEGIFTRYFWEGLVKRQADINRNGAISHSELLDYVRQQTNAYCEANPACQGMGFTPELQASAERFARPVIASATQGTTAAIAADILGGTNSANLKIEILPSAKVKAGQSVRFRISAKSSGDLVLLDINAAGKMTQLIPNQIMIENTRGSRLSPGETITIPDGYYGFDFVSGEPFGKGTLIAVLSEDPVSMEDITSQYLNLGPIESTDDYLANIARRIKVVFKEDTVDRTVNWSIATASYEIVPY